MVYSFEDGRFTVLSSRDRGYARRAQSFRLNTDTCSPTMEAEGTYVGVTRRDQTLDKAPRQFFVLFLGDLEAYICGRISSYKKTKNGISFLSFANLACERNTSPSLLPYPCTFESSLQGFRHRYRA